MLKNMQTLTQDDEKTYCVLRVVAAFPTLVGMKHDPYPTKDPEGNEMHPLAVLNVKRLLEKDSSKFLRIFGAFCTEQNAIQT